MTVEVHERDLEAKLRDLCARPRSARRQEDALPAAVGPVRHAPHVPGPDGGERPLGVPTLEDKIILGAVEGC